MSTEQLSAVSLKLPIFWPDKAAVWFAQIEAQFSIRGIQTDDTKYHYVVAALDQDVATRVLDLLQAPPIANKYNAIKTRLLSTFTLSESQRAAALLSINGLGDDKPSLLLDKMLALLGNHTPCFIFKEIFMRQMPGDIRPHLAQTDVSDFRELARIADVMWAARSPNVSALTRQLPRIKHPIPAASAAVSPHKQPEGDPFCYYHRRFGSKAKQCRPPCNFTQQGNGQASRQ